MKTKQNTKTKTVIISSIILGLSAISSYANTHQHAHQSSKSKAQPVKLIAQQAKTPHKVKYINRLPNNYKTVKHGNAYYYFVGDTCYTRTNKGYIIVTKPKGINYRYAPAKPAPKVTHHTPARVLRHR
ncbi:MAG: hypothetical protein ACSHX6_00975 [Akkermansiaceae bacterium]